VEHRSSAVEGVAVTRTFWRGKKVFLTGHTGFKGAWLALWLHDLGAKVVGYALPPETNPSLFSLARLEGAISSCLGDIRDRRALADAVQEAQPDVILHLAAQALVRASYRDPVDTYATNVMGTVHLLDAIRHVNSVKVAVVVTTDKVYRNEGSLWAYREDDVLGGHDPYSASKAACEIVVESYRSAFLDERGICVASARAGNVIGGGDWAEDRLIPDAIKAWSNGRTLEIRNPGAIRPWQHVLEPLHGYLNLAEQLWSKPDLAGSFNFGPDRTDCVAVSEVIQRVRTCFDHADLALSQEANAPREAAKLTLDNSKARALLGVEPVWSLERMLDRTVGWYVSQQRGGDALSLCRRDIEAFESDLAARRSGASYAL
jgi:CDP-glucose 4,6-dehydratase